jgi:ribosomal protein S18 acetylase RimI-like enzyme
MDPAIILYEKVGFKVVDEFEGGSYKIVEMKLNRD